MTAEVGYRNYYNSQLCIKLHRDCGSRLAGLTIHSDILALSFLHPLRFLRHLIK